MTHKFTKYMILATAALGLSALPALADTCSNQQIIVGLTCTLGDLTFSFEAVNIAGPVTTGDYLALETPATGVSGNDVILDFQFLETPPTDVHLVYSVTSTSADISGIDSSFTPAQGPPAPSINESACGTDPLTLTCSPLYANLLNTTGSLQFSPSFGPISKIWIDKDITDPGFSSFTDSIVETPEPSSEAAVLGLGLVAFLLWKRRASAAA